MPAPEHSLRSIETYPAPVREKYFTGHDYAMACLRTHNKRVKLDALNRKSKTKKPG